MINLESIAFVRIAAQAIASPDVGADDELLMGRAEARIPRTRNSPQLISSNDTAIGSSACVSPN